MRHYHIYFFSGETRTLVADAAYPTEASVMFELEKEPIGQFALENITGWCAGDEITVN